MNNSAAHSKLVDEILFKIGSLPNVRLWKNIIGVFRDFKSERIIRVGIPGTPDLQGIVKPNARALFIECKTGNAILNKDQEKYRDMVIKFGAIYILARSVEQALSDFNLQLDLK